MPFRFATELLQDEQGRVVGAKYLDEKTGKTETIIASAVILATGGAGQVYRETTNPALATGDGMALAALAGAIMQDMEFVQFHPTSLYLAGAPRFLLTEAIRGEGGLLLNIDGKRFMDSYHEKAELAPRDIVSRAIISEMEKTNSTNVFLDLTQIKNLDVRERFPQVYKNCIYYNLDIKKDWIPAAPAAHYYIGGVKTDINGATSLEGLYAAGEVACTGVHGANRLASNSLLEGLVFGIRAGRSAVDYVLLSRLEENPAFILKKDEANSLGIDDIRNISESIKSIMWNKVGIVRKPETLEQALDFFRSNYDTYSSLAGSRKAFELRNIFLIGLFTTFAAINRKESRGTHYRTDCPERNEQRQHSFFTIKDIKTV
jgi:L-aspartate oxidase